MWAKASAERISIDEYARKSDPARDTRLQIAMTELFFVIAFGEMHDRKRIEARVNKRRQRNQKIAAT